MTEHEDERIARRYRELRREVPSAALDKKVLTAARSAVAPRSFARRWAAPLAAAAVLVLAVGVTMQVQREEGKAAAVAGEAATARAKASAEPGRLASASPAKRANPASPAASVAAPTVAPVAASAAAPREIPFSPRRPLEPSPAATANAAAPAATANTAAPALGAVPGSAKITAPPLTDIARAQREASQAVAGFGVLSGGAPAAGSSGSGAAAAGSPGAGAAAGPFSIDQATSTGPQVMLVQPH